MKSVSKELTGERGNEASWVKRMATRGFLYREGWKNSDMEKPVISVVAPFTNASSCNHHFTQLAARIVAAVEREGGKAFVVHPPVVTDGMVMGAEGMRYSLVSRDVIADVAELHTEAYRCDAVITVGGCDKTQPGVLMPLARRNYIGITLYGGGRLPGDTLGECPNWEQHFKTSSLNAGAAYEAQGAFASGLIDIEELNKIEERCLGSTGSCGAMFTASTMASAFEGMGVALPGTSSHPAVDDLRANVVSGPGGTEVGGVSPVKLADCDASVAALFGMLRSGVRTRDLMTRRHFENAVSVVYAVGGSTNSVLHLLALAREAGVELSIDDFNTIGDRVPLLCSLKPHGLYSYAKEFNDIGGLPLLLKMMLKAGLLHGDVLTCTGRTLEENLAGVGGAGTKDGALPPPGQDVLLPIDAPFAPPGNHMHVVRGNLCPDGAVLKLSGKRFGDGGKFTGPCKVYDGEFTAYAAIMAG